MRVVDMTVLDGMRSPIRHVMRHMHYVLGNIAPEHVGRFDRTYSEFELEYLDDARWVCDVNVDTKHIRLSRGVVEVLWAVSLAYYRIYQAVAASENGNTQSKAVLDLSATTSSRQASSLLQWAIRSWHNGAIPDWPAWLPQPVDNPASESDEHVADEMCRCATAFLLHHELNHIRLKHDGVGELEMERDADVAAADWILDQLAESKQDRAMHLKRLLGITVALALIVAYGIHGGCFGGRSHPRSFDRLFNTLDRHADDPNHLVWNFAAVVLRLHLGVAGIHEEPPAGSFESGRSEVNAYVEMLSKVA